MGAGEFRRLDFGCGPELFFDGLTGRVSFAVEGHRTSSRLMTGPFFTFRGEAVAKNFILISFYASR